MTTNKLDLTAIRKRAESATEGPWEWDESSNCIDAPGFEVCIDAMNHDAEFIAHARQDVPALIAEVERLRESLEEIADIDDWDYGLEKAKDITHKAINLPEGWK
jgi:hypothetical protein